MISCLKILTNVFFQEKLGINHFYTLEIFSFFKIGGVFWAEKFSFFEKKGGNFASKKREKGGSSKIPGHDVYLPHIGSPGAGA